MTREQAWAQALELYDRWLSAATNHNGYGRRSAEAETRARLDAFIKEWGFEGTRVDPMVSWAKRQTLPLEVEREWIGREFKSGESFTVTYTERFELEP
jgi:hypothetical protein